MNTPSIPVMRPLLAPLDHVYGYLSQVYSNGVYTNNGPLINKLEERYADYLHVDPQLVVASSSATLALEGAVRLSKANIFNVPSYTFSAPALAVLNAGKKIVFNDIDPNKWQMDVSAIPNTYEQGLMYVLPFGSEIIDSKVYEFENVIIDAAASLGNRNLDLSRIKPNWVFVFSLHATKVLGIGEGGISVFGSPAAAQEYRAWINFGFSGNRNSDFSGTNAKMSEISAAFGLSSLDLIETEFSDWQQARDLTNSIEADLRLKSFSRRQPGANPYWIVDFESPERKIEVIQKLSFAGIQSRDWWSQGCHKMTIFNEFTQGLTFPNTDEISDQTLGLPFFRGLSEAHRDSIYECLK